ncbi:MAG: hypothetical protein JWO91_760 [Acidobacteriaceae bacterium]|nr:hypothetical protein [Acidobacteriaceae bacterium]
MQRSLHKFGCKWEKCGRKRPNGDRRVLLSCSGNFREVKQANDGQASSVFRI